MTPIYGLFLYLGGYMREVKVGSLYKNFKGHIYKIIAIGYDTEKYSDDKEKSKVVIYENIETHDVWVRPYNMFLDKVDKNKYPNIKQKYRFEELK